MRSVLSTTFAATALVAGMAAAQNSSSAAFPTVNMFINDALDGDAAYAASIVTACGGQTVYAIHCTSAPADIGTETCGPNAAIFTLTEGPSTYLASVTTSTAVAGHTGIVDISEGCALSGTTAASCAGELSVSVDGTSTKLTTTTVLTGDDYHRFDVAITGGAEKTASAAATCTAQSGAISVNARGGTALGATLAAGFLVIMAL